MHFSFQNEKKKLYIFMRTCLSNNWYEIMQNLKMTASQSLALGIICGTLAFIGLVIAVVFMRSVQQTEGCDE
jgi:hypothetical protein